MFAQIETHIRSFQKGVDQISSERKAVMTPLIDYIKQKIANQETIKLNFICTHNSRRSHMAQIWAKAIATYLHLPIDTYSGGTEATAFNPNAIAAMQNAGFEISGDRQVHNPRYTIQMGAGLPTFQTWSKVFSDPTNPTQAFAAIMTCSDADENCPYVPGAELRVALTYEDPKAYDGSPQQASAYEARAKQIGAELYYILSHA